MPFIENAWYAAALSREIVADVPLGRILLGRACVLLRQPDGRVAMLEDRCPHRFAPLSQGRVVDGAIACPYHGLRFAADGRCVHNPHGSGRIPDQARVRAWPTLERHGAVWFWPGDPDDADPGLLPDWPFLDERTHVTRHGYLQTAAGYQLSVDNLLDLSHFQFLHPQTLGSEAIAQAPAHVSYDGERHVRVRREIARETLQPFVADAFGLPQGATVTRRLEVQWQPPSLLTIDVAVRPDGEPDAAWRGAPSAHWITPRTETTAHYFFAFGLPLSAGEFAAELVRYAVDGLIQPFEREDLPMLAAQQRAMGEAELWSLQPVMLPIDAGALRARRIVERLLREEQDARAGVEERA
jgi:vanillate O-demethylase monooxygenase subunit